MAGMVAVCGASSLRQPMTSTEIASISARVARVDHFMLIRGASPLGLPHTLSRAPLRRRAPFAWLARDARSHAARSAGGCEIRSQPADPHDAALARMAP